MNNLANSNVRYSSSELAQFDDPSHEDSPVGCQRLLIGGGVLSISTWREKGKRRKDRKLRRSVSTGRNILVWPKEELIHGQQRSNLFLNGGEEWMETDSVNRQTIDGLVLKESFEIPDWISARG